MTRSIATRNRASSEWLLCFVSRSADGALGAVSSGIGGHRTDTRSGLTLDSGRSTPTHESDILVGRVPTGSTTVRVDAGDGAEVVAAVGTATTSPGSRVRQCRSASTRWTQAAICSSGSEIRTAFSSGAERPATPALSRRSSDRDERARYAAAAAIPGIIGARFIRQI